MHTILKIVKKRKKRSLRVTHFKNISKLKNHKIPILLAVVSDEAETTILLGSVILKKYKDLKSYATQKHFFCYKKYLNKCQPCYKQPDIYFWKLIRLMDTFAGKVYILTVKKYM